MPKKYEVGYGKPPKEHQWKKGQSGNPLGKRRKCRKATDAMTIRDYFVEELLEHVSPSVDGKKQKMRKAKAVVKSIVRDLITGKPREKVFLLRELLALGVFDRLDALSYAEEREADAEASEFLSEEERRTLEIINGALGIDCEDCSQRCRVRDRITGRMPGRSDSAVYIIAYAAVP